MERNKTQQLEPADRSRQGDPADRAAAKVNVAELYSRLTPP
jgi:hypothetical protein